MSHLTSKFKSTPTFSFKSKNQIIPSSNAPQILPSPQHYQVDQNDLSRLNRGVKFSRQLKGLKLPQTKANPGPGSYQMESSVKLDSFNKTQVLKKGQTRFRMTQQVTPSSAHYSIINTNRRFIPQFSIGRHSRSLRQLSGISDTPAPTKYNPNLKLLQQTVKIGIGTSKRRVNIHPQNNPGPGSFIIEKQFVAPSFNQNNSIFSKAKRNHTFTSNSLPGPGLYLKESNFAYNLRKKRGFSLKSRSQIKVSLTPAPGEYQNSSQKFKFKKASVPSLPKAQRSLFHSEFKRGASVPGPGHNQTTFFQMSKFQTSPSTKFQKAKLPHFIESTQNKKDFVNPQKLDVNKTSNPKFTIPTSKRRQIFQQELKKQSPGQFYNPNEKLIKPSEIVHKMPKSQRIKKYEKVNIGPGSYDSEVHQFSTKKSKFMKQKRKTFLDQVINSKLKTFKDHTFQSRQQFPNPPKYMNVSKKLQINESKIKNI